MHPSNMGGTYNPFYGFKRLPEKDSYENLFPFSLDEQHKIIQALPDHWKPYFDTAFKIGLRQGEQIALRSEDIDWERDLIHVKRAITRDENGKIMIGRTKNRYSRRTIRLLPVMRSALEEQKKIYDYIQGNFFFCSNRSHGRYQPSAEACMETRPEKSRSWLSRNETDPAQFRNQCIELR